ncbi:MAG: hypothetical protein GVY26_02055 [Bacteroidetes bacterium]|jgi:hypothetical protein|nr:hypothetical protein [Bacteroidota bacterium]
MKKHVLWLFLLSLSLTTSVIAQKKMTTFNPSKDGFNFDNRFKTHTGDPGSIKIDWGGLCGGMSFAAADYFYSSVRMPRQNYAPAKGTRLFDYLYERQLNSLSGASIDKVAENWFNPFGSRNEEFWGWAVDERLKELKRFIDRNRPIPILLFNGRDNNVAKNHWVLAIGYDLGGYKFRKKNDPRVERIKIFVYDPNEPNKTCVLVPRKGGEWMMDYHIWNTSTNRLGKKLDYNKRRWRHYYVYKEFRHKSPPAIRNNSTVQPGKYQQLFLTFRTGGDDLRGGNDNVHAIIIFERGDRQVVKNLNRSKRWPDNSSETVRIPLKRAVDSRAIREVRLETTFGGGMGGDNWNLDRLTIHLGNRGIRQKKIYEKEGDPLLRFTGDRKRFTASRLAR